MRQIKGIKDIHTHGSLSREGRLKSVARDWHSPSVQRNNSDAGSDWNVEHHLVKPGTSKHAANILRLDKNTVVASQIQALQYTLEEFEKAAHEKFEVSKTELARVRERLSQLGAG